MFTQILVLSLSDKQKALEQYADTAEAQKFVSQAPIPQQQPQFTQPQIQYIQAAPTPQAAQARKAKILRDPVVWQISEKQMQELKWKRKQLLQAQKAQLEKKKAARAKRGPPPKLGQSKATLRKAEEAKTQVPPVKASPAKGAPPSDAKGKAPAKPKAPNAKPPAKPPAKGPAKPAGK